MVYRTDKAAAERGSGNQLEWLTLVSKTGNAFVIDQRSRSAWSRALRIGFKM